MKTNRIGILLVLALMVALVAAAGLAQGPQLSLAQEDAGTGAPVGQGTPLAPAGLVSGALSYQGRLLDSNGDPVDGTRTMSFRLYTEEGGIDPVWDQTLGVSLDGGLFTVNLDVDTALFDGQALWLGIQIEGDADELDPRQPLLPAPYALSLRPGAVVRGALGDTPTLVLEGEEYALWAEANSSVEWHPAYWEPTQEWATACPATAA
jgi:hypothetical protein